MPEPTGTPFYCSQQGLIDAIGNSYVIRWSDVDGTGVINTTRVNLALLIADAAIDQAFRTVGYYNCPIGAHLSLGPTSQALTYDWASLLGTEWIYRTRGVTDNVYLDKIAPRLAHAKVEMALCASGKRTTGFDATIRWPVSNGAPVICAGPGQPIIW